MPDSPSELLSDVRKTLEHQLDAFGPTVYGQLKPDPAARAPEKTADAPASKTAPKTAQAEPAPATAPAEAVPVESDAPVDTNLFGESHPAPETDAIEAAGDESPYARIEKLIPVDSPLHRIDSLEEARAYVAGTTLIPIDDARTNPVFGVGHPDADLMVIGEAPGADEDRQGEPFVGRAGQLLTKILQAIGFERSDVYIANILKSRPPNNRDPLPDEVEAHIPILYKQIVLIRPKILLCVGKTAGTSLLQKKTSLASLRGTFHDYHGLPLMVTYHPAALLRNPHWKRPTWEDVKKLRTHYDELGGS